MKDTVGYKIEFASSATHLSSRYYVELVRGPIKVKDSSTVSLQDFSVLDVHDRRDHLQFIFLLAEVAHCMGTVFTSLETRYELTITVHVLASLQPHCLLQLTHFTQKIIHTGSYA